MKEDFDFDRVGKRLPYTAPDGFLDDMENCKIGDASFQAQTQLSPLVFCDGRTCGGKYCIIGCLQLITP